MNFASSRIAGSASQRGDNSGRSSGKGGYQALGNSDPRGLQAVTAASFASSSFAAAGLDFGMMSYLRSQDRTFTAQNVLNAANDIRTLGFSPRDRAALFDHTTIDRYDPKARTTNKALQDYQGRVEEDDELSELHDDLWMRMGVGDHRVLKMHWEGTRHPTTALFDEQACASCRCPAPHLPGAVPYPNPRRLAGSRRDRAGYEAAQQGLGQLAEVVTHELFGSLRDGPAVLVPGLSRLGVYRAQ
jgi:hypothetical protein